MLWVARCKSLFLFLAEAEEATDGLDEVHGFVDDPIDGFVDGLANGFDDFLDFFGDAANAKQTGEEADDHGNGAGESFFDPVGGGADLSLGDSGDGIDDGVDKIENL